MGMSEKKLAREHTTMDTSRPTDPAMHSRGQTTLARTLTVYELHPYDCHGQGMKMKVITYVSVSRIYRHTNMYIIMYIS